MTVVIRIMFGRRAVFLYPLGQRCASTVDGIAYRFFDFETMGM